MNFATWPLKEAARCDAQRPCYTREPTEPLTGDEGCGEVSPHLLPLGP